MKKLLLIPAILVGLATANAQRGDYLRPRFGLKGGINFANITATDAGDIEPENGIAAVHFGGYLDLPLAHVFSIQPGLFLTGKGARYTIGNPAGNNWTEVSSRPYYLEAPVLAVGKIPVAPGFKLFFGAGPYAAMGIGGTTEVRGEVGGNDFIRSESLEFSNDDPRLGDNGDRGNLKRYDFGLDFTAGMEIRKVTLNMGYGLGLINVRPGSVNDDGDSFKNRVFSLSFGFLF